MKKPKPKVSQGWMLTLADLLALMLTFFVMLFSMREPDGEKWAPMTESFDQWFNPARVSDPAERTHAPLKLKSVPDTGSLDYWKIILEEKLRRAKATNVTLTMREDGLVISLAGDVFFAPGSARLQDKQVETMRLLAQALEQIGKPVTLQGHTDPVPIRNGEFASNWELSLARASAVAEDVRKLGFTGTLHISGYGAGQFTQDIGDATAKRDYTEARRVDMVLQAGD